MGLLSALQSERNPDQTMLSREIPLYSTRQTPLGGQLSQTVQTVLQDFSFQSPDNMGQSGMSWSPCQSPVGAECTG